VDDLADEFESLLDAVDRGECTFLDRTRPKMKRSSSPLRRRFLRAPRELRAALPRLYALLQEFYALDPRHGRARRGL